MVSVAIGLLSGCLYLGDRDWDQRLDPDGDGVDFPGDCDDRDPSVAETERLYADADHDGYGDGTAEARCPGHVGWVEDNGDCDEADAKVNPGALELCDGIDNNCDRSVDEGLPVDWWYPDEDADGSGSYTGSVVSCDPPDGWVSTVGDCDDHDPARGWLTPEVCDGIDNNCDGYIDNGLALIATAIDADGDGYGDLNAPQSLCEVPAGYAPPYDCDDTDPDVHPGVPEDCNNGIDEGCTGLDETDLIYQDEDGDGYGRSDRTAPACPIPLGWSRLDGDCADDDARRSPGATEVCPDGLDNDCDGNVDDFDVWWDADGDGAGVSTGFRNACAPLAGYVDNDVDCDDTDASTPAYVSTTGIPGGTGTWDDPFGTIDDGLASRVSCLVLWPGTHLGGQVPELDVQLWGMGSPEDTLVQYAGGDCAGAGWPGCSPTLTVSGPLVILQDLSVVGGGGMPSSAVNGGVEERIVCGGALYIDSGYLALQNVLIRDALLPGLEAGVSSTGVAYTLESAGGGLCAVGGTVSATDTSFIGNSAGKGGGVYVAGGSYLGGERIAFTENEAAEGGAGWIGAAEASFSQTRSWCNTADRAGGFWVGDALALVSFTNADFLWDEAPSAATELWAVEGATVVMDSVLVVGTTPGLAAIDGDGTQTAQWSVGSEIGGSGFGNVAVDASVVTTYDIVLEPTCDGNPANDSFVLAAGSVAIDAGNISALDTDGSRADVGSNGGPGGAW